MNDNSPDQATPKPSPAQVRFAVTAEGTNHRITYDWLARHHR